MATDKTPRTWKRNPAKARADLDRANLEVIERCRRLDAWFAAGCPEIPEALAARKDRR